MRSHDKVNITKINTASKTNDVYTFTDDSTMQREQDTLTPNGCKMNGRWVYRDSGNNMLGFDKYSNDLAERFSLDLYNLSR